MQPLVTCSRVLGTVLDCASRGTRCATLELRAVQYSLLAVLVVAHKLAMSHRRLWLVSNGCNPRQLRVCSFVPHENVLAPKSTFIEGTLHCMRLLFFTRSFRTRRRHKSSYRLAHGVTTACSIPGSPHSTADAWQWVVVVALPPRSYRNRWGVPSRAPVRSCASVDMQSRGVWL